MEICHFELILLIESAFKIDRPKTKSTSTDAQFIAANGRLLIKFAPGRVAKAPY
jgi:hypothetical protein